MVLNVNYNTLELLIIAEGKKAIAENPAKFNKEASEKYKQLLPQEKKKLKMKAEPSEEMGVNDILREAEKVFSKASKFFYCIPIANHLHFSLKQP